MRIVLCYPAKPKHLEQIQAAAPHAEIVDAGQERINEELPSADIFCGHAKVPVDWRRVVDAGNLKWIQSSAAGMDHCLVPEVIDSDIVVSSCSGVFAYQVAEQTLALLLGSLRSMDVFYRAQQQREFVRRPTRDLRGKTIGIVGFGGNGRRIAKVLAGFDTRIVATDLFVQGKPEYVESLWRADELQKLTSVSDVVILCVPLNSKTQGMVNSQTLAAFKSGSVLVNVARGPVVVEADLVEALRRGKLSSAALDVTEVEPLPDTSPLWDMPGVIISPHVGAQSDRRVDDSTALFCRNLKRYLTNQPPLNLVDKSLGIPHPEHRISSE